MDPLLELLHQNSKLSSAELGKLLNLSAAQVEAKIASYEEAGVIPAYIEGRITPERGGGFDRLAERIARFDEVKSCWLMSGGYDLAIIVEGNHLREIARFVSDKLSTVEGVISTATRFRLKTYKQNGVLLAPPVAVERLPVTP
jgi:DNA-binding Lrp family transcriptional regulator